MHAIATIGFFVSTLVMFVYSGKAWNRRLPASKRFEIRVIPRFGRRDEFFADGWRHRNLAIRFQLLSLAFALLWGFTLPH